jgi:uncharacterized repeat protein (TIGR01451 family)
MHGGGILNDSGLVEFVHSTISGNSAIMVGEFGGVGGGFRNLSGRVVSKSSLIAGNIASSLGADCSNAAELVSVGYNLIGDANGCDWPLHEHDLVNVAPLLGPLQDNGGLTETRALLVGSPAFDVISVGDCTDISDRSVGVDQRGISRPQGVGCDIGAFEAQAAELSVTKMATVAQVREGESAVFCIEVNNDGPLEATGLVISDVLPLGLTFASSAASQGAYAGSTGEWSVGDLNVGLSATLVLTSTAEMGAAGTLITNVAAIAAVGQFDSDHTDNRDAASVTVSASGVAYLPSILKGHTPSATFPIVIGSAIAREPIQYLGQVFYTSQAHVPDTLPSGGSFYFSAQPYVLTEVVVDDELMLFLGEEKVFSFDFSTSGLPVPAVVEMPRSLLERAVGKTLSVIYRDVYGDVYHASEMWLIWVP